MNAQRNALTRLFFLKVLGTVSYRGMFQSKSPQCLKDRSDGNSRYNAVKGKYHTQCNVKSVPPIANFLMLFISMQMMMEEGILLS